MSLVWAIIKRMCRDVWRRCTDGDGIIFSVIFSLALVIYFIDMHIESLDYISFKSCFVMVCSIVGSVVVLLAITLTWCIVEWVYNVVNNFFKSIKRYFVKVKREVQQTNQPRKRIKRNKNVKVVMIKKQKSSKDISVQTQEQGGSRLDQVS